MKKIAYFSYKGGAGRSSLAYNTIPLLAEKMGATAEQPIILLDLDVDSAGMTFLLQCNDISKDDYCIQDLVAGKIPGLTRTPEDTPLKNHPFFSNLIPVGKKFGLRGDKDDSVLFLPVKTGAEISFEASYDQADNYLHDLAKLCSKYNCKALVLDTPTGDQLTAKWALEVSSDILTVMKITFQFRRGTIDFLKRKDREYCLKNFIIVPNVVPTEEIVVDGAPYNYEAVKCEIIDNITRSITRNKVNLDMLKDGKFGVPEVKRFKLKEGILYTIDALTADERNAFEQYKEIVDIISNN